MVVVSGVWWLGTRSHDFLTPPPEDRLAEITAATLKAYDPQEEEQDDPGPPPETVTETPPAGARVSGGTEPPQLGEFAKLARERPDQLPALAGSHQTAGKLQLALLAHERIIDSGPATEEQLADSIRATQSLRAVLPPWFADPAEARVVTLHAATAATNADRIAPYLEGIAEEMTKASSGILRIQPLIHRGRDIGIEGAAPPVAIWLTGPGEGAAGTPVLSFMLAGDDDPLVSIARGVIRLLRVHMAAINTLEIPAPPSDTEAPVHSLLAHVTRLVWHELADSLNPENP